jgi:dienelactone hydrolase
MPPAQSSAIFRPHDEGAATAQLRPSASEGAWNGLDGQFFELVSRGDFVNGLLHRPQIRPADGLPLVIALHDAGEQADSPTLDAAAAWSGAGLAVARLDLPLHGHRASPKLSERLIQGCHALAAGTLLDLDTRALVEEFARQSVSDLLRTAEALGALPGIDRQRLAFVGCGVGAWVALWAAPFAPGLRLCALAGGIGQLEDRELDPVHALTACMPEASGTEPDFIHEQLDAAGLAAPAAQARLFEALPQPREAIRETTETAGSGRFTRSMADAIQTRLADLATR